MEQAPLRYGKRANGVPDVMRSQDVPWNTWLDNAITKDREIGWPTSGANPKKIFYLGNKTRIFAVYPTVVPCIST